MIRFIGFDENNKIVEVVEFSTKYAGRKRYWKKYFKAYHHRYEIERF